MDYFKLALIIGGLLLFLYIIHLFKTKCPNCGKFNARKILRKQSNGTSYLNDSRKEHFINHCKCKYCGFEWTQRDTTTRKN